MIVFEQNSLLNISATQDLKAMKVFDIQGRNIFDAKKHQFESLNAGLFPPTTAGFVFADYEYW